MDSIRIIFEDIESKIYVNPNTKLGEIYNTTLRVFSKNYKNVLGLCFNGIDETIVYLGLEQTNFQKKWIDFIDEYDQVFVMYLRTQSNSGLTNNEYSLTKEIIKMNYETFENCQNVSNIFGGDGRYNISMSNPEFHIVNNYGSRSSTRNQNRNVSVRETDRENQERSPQPVPQPQPTPQQAPNANQYFSNFYTMDMDYNPSTGQFNVRNGQNPNVNNLANQILNSFNRGVGNNTFASSFMNILGGLNGMEEVRVLTQEQIDALESGTYANLKNNQHILSDCTQCGITLESFTDNSEVIALPCKHAFMRNSITHWLRNNSNKCPTCRGIVAEGVPR